MLGAVIMINMAICVYNTDMYKYIALTLNFQDQQTSVFLSIGVIFYIGSNYLVTFVWEKYGFDYSLIILIFVNLINTSGILYSKQFFLYEIFFGRFCYGYLMTF